MAKEVYSICFMCTQRCPIRVWWKMTMWSGSKAIPMWTAGLCAKGSAGLSLLHDHERPQYPMIRIGARGAGQWQRATWDEALDFVAAKLKKIIKKHGPQSVLWGERNNLNTHIVRTFMKAWALPTILPMNPCAGVRCTPPWQPDGLHLRLQRWAWITPTPGT